jgi:outer membrane protein assembly factor BamD
LRRLNWFHPLLLLVALTAACAGGMPKIPDTPDSVLQKADEYFDRGRYFQSSELYKAFIERYPGHDRSDYAQYRMAESYFHDQQYELAAVEYRVIVSRYGYSEYVDDALFQIGVCYWELSPSPEKDQSKTFEAVQMFEQFIQTFPDNNKVPAAREYLRKCNEKLAEKYMIAVKLYYRAGNLRSVEIYCDKIIEQYPDNYYWAQAYYYKGIVRLVAEDNEKAAFCFQKVIDYGKDAGSLRYDAEERLKEATQ